MVLQEIDRNWYFSRSGKRYGPYTYAALTEAAQRGVITADTNIWRLGWADWHPAAHVPGLIATPALERSEAGAEAGSVPPPSEDAANAERFASAHDDGGSPQKNVPAARETDPPSAAAGRDDSQGEEAEHRWQSAVYDGSQVTPRGLGQDRPLHGDDEAQRQISESSPEAIVDQPSALDLHQERPAAATGFRRFRGLRQA